MHNYYTFLYNRLVFETLKRLRGNDEAVVFARSATVGGQRFPVHWGGDNVATYESMAESLRGGLSLGLSGFGFWSHDIGGFQNKAPAYVYKRWVRSACCRATAGCTASPLIACHGSTTRKRSTSCAISPS